MTSRGDSETVLLRENIEGQLKRLLTQLQDIDQMKDELDEEEYSLMRQETVDQLKEFEESLQKSISGNMSLVDQIGGVQLAIQSAIRSSTSPEILNMFIQKQNGSLRSRLAGLESDRRLDKISNEAYESQAVEILQMLEKLKEPLSPAEQNLLQKTTINMSDFTAASTEVNSKVLGDASRDLHK
jgi:hypothetical protein